MPKTLGDSLSIVHIIHDLINEYNGGRRHHSLSQTTLKKERLALIVFIPIISTKQPEIHHQYSVVTPPDNSLALEGGPTE